MDGGKRLGRAFRTLRLQRDLTQEQVAERAGCVPSYISRFESGAFETPRYRTLDSLARAVGFTDAAELMRKLEDIDRTTRPVDDDADKIRALADELATQLAAELSAVPESQRRHAAEEAIRTVRSFRQTRGRHPKRPRTVGLAKG